MRLLIVTPRIFFPADTGGKIRSANMFRRIAALSDTTLLCYRSQHDSEAAAREMLEVAGRVEFVEWRENPTASVAGRLQAAANLLSREAFAVAKYARPSMSRRIREFAQEQRYDLIVCDFLQMAKNLDGVGGGARVLFQHNAEGLIRRRQFEHTRNPVWRAYLYWEWRRLARFEARAGRSFDHLIMVSEQDRQAMARQYGISNTSAIPLGVDADFFRPSAVAAPGEAPKLVFTGSMDWLPNQDAVRYFVGRVLPLVRLRAACTFIVVGRNPPGSIRRLADRHPGVVVTGRVDDVRPFLHDASVYVVPLRIGGGTRIKIFEAMAAQCAVVSTRIGAEGLPVTDTEDILLADSPEEFAGRVVELLEDAARRERLARAGRRLVSEGYGWEAAARRFLEICAEVVEDRKRRDREGTAGSRGAA